MDEGMINEHHGGGERAGGDLFREESRDTHLLPSASLNDLITRSDPTASSRSLNLLIFLMMITLRN